MMKNAPHSEELKPQKHKFFESFSSWVTRATGSPTAFLSALAVVLVWAISGPFFHYSETWQLVINTGTTIITFLMVFVIQKAQNKDSVSIQLKLNELIAATKGASNRLVGVETLDQDELDILCKHYETLAELTRKASDLRKSHSIEEAYKDTKDKLKEEEGATPEAI